MSTILVVDDRPSNRQFLLTLLSYTGHTILEAADGAEALRMVRSAHPQLVITDILMPKMDGYELVRSIRADPALKPTPVIFYTATYSEPQANELAASCDVRTVLSKPSDPEHILAAVNRELGIESAPVPGAAEDGPTQAHDAGSVEDTVEIYLRDLQEVKVTFDDLVDHSNALQSARTRINELSTRFSDNVTRLQRITSKLSALIEVGMAMTAERDPERLVKVFFAAACDIIESTIAAVGVLDDHESTLRHTFAKGVDPAIYNTGGDVRAEMLGALLANRTRIRRRFPDGAGAGLPRGHPPIANIMALPIASPDRIYGWIYFADKLGPGDFNEEDEQLAALMATELALRLEHTMLYNVIQRHAASLQLEVTERRRAQEVLREREAALYRAQVMAQLGHMIIGPKGRFEQWSQTLPSLIGVSTEAMPRDVRRWLSLVHPEDRAYARHAAMEAARMGLRAEIEYRLKRGDTWIHLRQVVEPIAGPGAGTLAARWFNTIQDVSEQRRAAAALSESEERFRQVTENIREVFWLSDKTENKTLYVSPAYEQIFGRQPGALYASEDDWIEAIHPDDRRRVVAAMESRQGRGEYDEEYRITRPDGSIRWIRDRAFPVLGPNGRVVRVAGVAEDITVRRRATDALRESERRFGDLLRNVELISMMLDREGRISFCNDYLLRLTGWKREDVLGGNWFELFIPPRVRCEVKDVFASLLADLPRAWHHQNEIQTRSGDRRLIRWNNTVMRSESGEVIGVASLGEDVTDRVRMEQALVEAEQKYRSIFESAVDGIFQTSLDGRVLNCNPAAAEMFGYASPDDLIAGVADLGRELYVDPVSRESFFNQLRDSGVVRGFETRLRRKDGEEIWVSLSSSLETDNRDGSTYTLGSVQNITERRRQSQKIERLTRMYAVLSGINAMIVRVGSSDDLFRECCRVVVEKGRFTLASVHLTDLAAGETKIAASAGMGSAPMDEEGIAMAPPHYRLACSAAANSAVRERRAFLVNDVASDPRISRAEVFREQGIRSLAALPLLAGGEPVGAFTLYSADADYFDAQEMELLAELAGDISFALEHIQRAEQLEYLTFYDSLTGLANRTLFLDRLSQRLRMAVGTNDRVAVVLSDINRLRTVNDSLGRRAGDELLKQFSERLARRTSRDDLARLGADNFAIVLSANGGEPELTARLAMVLGDAVDEPFKVEGSELQIAVKCGISLYPKDGLDAESLLRNAEFALRRAKNTGEGRVFHSQEFSEKSNERLSLENSLRRALRNDEFALYYQPKINLASRAIVGVEALMRWRSADHGLVPPVRFIPLLEETGLILEVGAWAFRRAVLDRAQWQSKGLLAPPIAVNVSPIQLRQGDFVDVVRGVMSAGAAGLDLEITESMIMEDIPGNTVKLKAVRELGVKIAIDDFGTGYSSLAYLTRLPVHALKIDRSFVVTMQDDPDTMTLVSTIISLAHSLKLIVIAEGVETEEQAKMLHLLRCDEAQGFLFARPLPMDDLTALLQPGQ